MIRSTFGSFTTAQLGLAASQKALDVTGQNIANINTEGYTRQRVDLVSFSSFSGASRYALGHTNVGQGVLVKNISQIRNPYLDVRYRDELSKIGQADTKLSGLEDLEYIFDKTAKEGLGESISDLVSQLHTLAGNTGSQFQGVVKSSAEVLVKLFNQYSKQVDDVRKQQEYELQSVDIPEVNTILKNIAELNRNIKNNSVNGSGSLELMDQRNMLIDELSSYVQISVDPQTVSIGGNETMEIMKINMVGSDGTKYALIDDEKIAELTYTKDASGIKIGLTDITPGGPNPDIDVTDKLGAGSLQGALKFLTEDGEFGGSGKERGVGYYEKMLDTMANQFATALNKANSIAKGEYDGDPDLEEDRALFEADGGGTITAKNIKIAKDWADGKYGITTTKKAPIAGDNSAASENVTKIIALFSSKLEYYANPANPNNDPVDPTAQKIFTGSFVEFFSEIGNQLALDVKSTTTVLDNHLTVAEDISGLKDSISGVSLDEEGINLLKYQKSYNAAARFMTTLDEALETIISKMGVIGR